MLALKGVVNTNVLLSLSVLRLSQVKGDAVMNALVIVRWRSAADHTFKIHPLRVGQSNSNRDGLAFHELNV